MTASDRGPTVVLERDGARQGRLAHLVLSRPTALNAISSQLAEDLLAACDALAADRSVWAVVLRGEGERAFCAGADLKERDRFSPEQWQAQRALFRRMFAAVRAVPQPMIAAVHGYALGGGTELALLADLVVASEDAIFGLTETGLGLIPGGGGTQTLPRLVGRARAKELLFTARRIPAERALAIGLVNHVVPRPDLLPAAVRLADEILANSPVAVREVKWAMDQGLDRPFEEALEREHAAYLRAIASEDRREGIRAFNEKRPARFLGR